MPATESAGRSPRARPLLLLVEDNRDTLVAGAHMLHECGFDVEIARGGNDGLSKAARLHPDVIVTDLVMPNTSGFRVCEQLHRDADTRDIPVIVYTGLTDATTLAPLCRVGVRVFAIKPCLPTVIGHEALSLLASPRTEGVRIVSGYGEQLTEFANEVAARAVNP